LVRASTQKGKCSVKRLSVISLVLVMLLLAVGTVSADAPIIYRGPSSWHWDYNPSPCAFPVQYDSVGNGQETIFFDNEGNFVKWRWHGVGTASLSAPDTSDVVLTGNFSLTEEWNEITQTFTVHGVDAAFTVPGSGTVWAFEAGRLLPDGRIVGNHVWSPEKAAVLCALLAGE
jgi:hypothetical protein